MPTDLAMLECLATNFPNFYQHLNTGYGDPVDALYPPIYEKDISFTEQSLGIPLPHSYKLFLQCTGGFCLLGGAIHLSFPPFVHDFPPFATLTPQQQSQIIGPWPPLSQGLLCFGDFWLVGDGDQVLFDHRQGLNNGEYPVLYYDHDARPATVRLIASSFHEWVERILTNDDSTK